MNKDNKKLIDKVLAYIGIFILSVLVLIVCGDDISIQALKYYSIMFAGIGLYICVNYILEDKEK